MSTTANTTGKARSRERREGSGARRRLIFLTAIVLMLALVGVVQATPAGAANPTGSVIAWGDNGYAESTVPAGLSGVTAVSAGRWDSLALKSDGTVVAWGSMLYGPATPPPGLSGVTAIAAAAYHSLALKSDGTVVGWGPVNSGETAPPAGLSGVTAIAVGNLYSLALKTDGTVVAWGPGNFGEWTTPPGLSGVTAIAAGDSHSLALRADGTVVAWGSNSLGQATVPPGLSGVTAIAAGAYHSLALRSDGTVSAWGYDDDYGQATVPPGLSGVTAIAAGDYHSLALKSDGTVVAWGCNSVGQPMETLVPAGPTGVTAIAAGGSHDLAVVPPVLIGSAQVQISVDSTPAGTAEAFRYIATGTGNTGVLSVYLDAGSTATSVQLGLYADAASGNPGKLIVSGQIGNPIAGRWNTVRVARGTAVKAGAAYWLAILAPNGAGMVKFRDLPGGNGGPTQISAQHSLKSLAGSWKAGSRYANGPASLYAATG